MKFCTIGCGGHASDVHGPSQQRIAREDNSVELAACCDADLQKAGLYRDLFGFSRAYQDIGTMLASEQPDAVALIVPVNRTCELALPILRRGIPLFMEKPPGLTREELQSMYTAWEVGRGINFVAFNRRFMPVMQWAHAILEQDFPCEQTLQITYNLTRSRRADPDFSTTTIHAIDAVCFLARSPYVTASLSYQEISKGIHMLTIQGICQSGTRICINIHPFAGVQTENAVIQGIDRTLYVTVLEKNGQAHSSSAQYWTGNTMTQQFLPSAEQVAESSFYEETRAFFNAVRERRQPSPSLEDCQQQIALMEAVRNRKEYITF